VVGGAPNGYPGTQYYDGFDFRYQSFGVSANDDFLDGHCQVTIDSDRIFVADDGSALSTNKALVYDWVNQVRTEVSDVPFDGNNGNGNYVACGLVTRRDRRRDVVFVHSEKAAVFSVDEFNWSSQLLPAFEMGDNLSAAQLDDTFVVVGGNSGGTSDKVFRFNPDTDAFEEVPQRLSTPKEFAIAVAVPDDFVLCQ